MYNISLNENPEYVKGCYKYAHSKAPRHAHMGTCRGGEEDKRQSCSGRNGLRAKIQRDAMGGAFGQCVSGTFGVAMVSRRPSTD